MRSSLSETPNMDVPANTSVLQPVWNGLLEVLGQSYFEFPLSFLPVVVVVVGLTGVGFTVLDVYVYRKLPAAVAWLHGLKILAGYSAAAAGLYVVHLNTRWVVLEVPSEAPGLATFLLQLAAFMLIGEFATYWWHRLEHGSRFVFEHVHYLHHSERGPLTIWTNFVVHPVEGFVVMVCLYTAPLVIGAHPMTVAAYAIANTTAMVITHCGYDLPLYPRWLLPGPIAHELHHSEKRPTNLSVVMTYGDKLFGTYRTP